MDWKQPDRVRELRESLNGRGINYLFNIDPDPLGASACTCGGHPAQGKVRNIIQLTAVMKPF